MKKQKIGIIGSGIVGQTLGAGFIKNGCEVMIGSRSPEKLADWVKENGDKASTGTFQDTVKFGSLIVLSVKGTSAKQVLNISGLDQLNGKIIIDTTNPIGSQPPKNGVLDFFTDMDHSLMEILQNHVPNAKFVKAFNSVGSQFMVDPDFDGITPTMFICGNDDPAKKEVSDIIEQFGWEVEDMGKVEAARAIEPLCMLWCIPGLRENRWSHAFKLLKK